MKTADLTGPALDWAVTAALCVGTNTAPNRNGSAAYTTDWSQGGPIIERENICIRGVEDGFHAWYHQRPPKMFGPRMLVAAMRCFVASRLGDDVEVPDELA